MLITIYLGHVTLRRFCTSYINCNPFFTCATLASADISCCRVSLCPSVTSRCSTETAKRRITIAQRRYTVSQKNVSLLACYNFDVHEWILTFFGRNVTDKVGNQNTLYYATSNNLCFCTTWQNAETRKSHISLNWIVLHTQCTCALYS